MLDAAELIRASERLESIMDGAAAAGTLKKGASRQHIDSLTRRLERERKHDVRNQPAPATALHELAAFGIKVVESTRPAGGS